MLGDLEVLNHQMTGTLRGGAMVDILSVTVKGTEKGIGQGRTGIETGFREEINIRPPPTTTDSNMVSLDFLL